MSKPIQMERGVKYRDADKMALIPVKTVAVDRQEILRKPEWMKIKLPATPVVFRASKPQCVKTGSTPFVRKPPALTLLNVLITARRPL